MQALIFADYSLALISQVRLQAQEHHGQVLRMVVLGQRLVPVGDALKTCVIGQVVAEEHAVGLAAADVDQVLCSTIAREVNDIDKDLLAVSQLYSPLCLVNHVGALGHRRAIRLEKLLLDKALDEAGLSNARLAEHRNRDFIDALLFGLPHGLRFRDGHLVQPFALPPSLDLVLVDVVSAAEVPHFDK